MRHTVHPGHHDSAGQLTSPADHLPGGVRRSMLRDVWTLSIEDRGQVVVQLVDESVSRCRINHPCGALRVVAVFIAGLPSQKHDKNCRASSLMVTASAKLFNLLFCRLFIFHFRPTSASCHTAYYAKFIYVPTPRCSDRMLNSHRRMAQIHDESTDFNSMLPLLLERTIELQLLI